MRLFILAALLFPQLSNAQITPKCVFEILPGGGRGPCKPQSSGGTSNGGAQQFQNSIENAIRQREMEEKQQKIRREYRDNSNVQSAKSNRQNRQTETQAKENESHERVKSQLVNDDNGDASANSKAVQVTTPANPVVDKDMKALDCALESTIKALEDAGARGQMELQSLREDLNSVREDLSQPLSGKANSYKIYTRGFDLSELKGESAKQLVSQINVLRDHSTGRVSFSVQFSGSRAGREVDSTDLAFDLDKMGRLNSKDGLPGPLLKCLSGAKVD